VRIFAPRNGYWYCKLPPMSTENNIKSLSLIKGTFTADDARDVLLSILNYKINYHQMKNFSSELKTGKEEAVTTERIEQLRKTREQVIAAIEEAVENGYLLNVKADLHIEMTKEK